MLEIGPVNSEDELRRRLPEINRIDGSLQRQVVEAFLDHCPDYFWEKPASSSGNYHPESHRARYGLLLHTKRAYTVYEELGRTYQAQDLVDRYELNCGRAAILLHDLFKYGKPPGEEHTVSSHDRLAAEFFRENTELPDEVVECVDSHNGPWCPGKMPESELEHLHHLADMTASRVSIPGIGVYRPCSELTDSFPDLVEWRPDE